MIQDFYNKLVQAGLPVISANDDGRAEFSRSLTDQEILAYIRIFNPEAVAQIQKQKDSKIAVANIPGWATWTVEQFTTWCNNNLMTDAAIDALSIPAALKTNVKTNNLFTRNAGKMLIALRDNLWQDL